MQCFLFGDGGLTALGANFVNMGLIGSVVGYAIYAPIRRWIGGRRGILIAAVIAAWFTVLLAAGACAAELSASGNHRDFFRILSWMALVHAVIGLGEAIITGLVVRFILLTRPDLIEQDPTFALEPQVPGGGPPRRWLADHPGRARRRAGRGRFSLSAGVRASRRPGVRRPEDRVPGR